MTGTYARHVERAVAETRMPVYAETGALFHFMKYLPRNPISHFHFSFQFSRSYLCHAKVRQDSILISLD